VGPSRVSTLEILTSADVSPENTLACRSLLLEGDAFTRNSSPLMPAYCAGAIACQADFRRPDFANTMTKRMLAMEWRCRGSDRGRSGSPKASAMTTEDFGRAFEAFSNKRTPAFQGMKERSLGEAQRNPGFRPLRKNPGLRYAPSGLRGLALNCLGLKSFRTSPTACSEAVEKIAIIGGRTAVSTPRSS